jgi:hypothetical protein
MEKDQPIKQDQKTIRQLCWRLLKMAVVVYFGVIILLMFLENRLVYRPLKDNEDWQPAPRPEIQDIEITSSDGNRLHAWWLPHAKNQEALLYFHGNAGNLSHRGQSIVKLHDWLETSVLIIDYPGYGKSTGSPSEAGCYAAGDCAFRWLADAQKIHPEKITLYGGSLGGGVAINLAHQNPHKALVLIKTFTSAPDVGKSLYPWLPIRWLMRNQFDNLGKIGQCRKPVFIAHGTSDSLVPYDHAQKLYQAANHPKFLYSIDKADHNDRMPDDFFPRLKQFLKEVE